MLRGKRKSFTELTAEKFWLFLKNIQKQIQQQNRKQDDKIKLYNE